MSGRPRTSRWPLLTWIAAAVGLVVVLAGIGIAGSALTTSSATTTAPDEQRRTCTSPAGTWTAVLEVPSGAPTAQLVALEGPDADDGWRIARADDGRLEVEDDLDVADLPMDVGWDDRARLLTPDGECAIFLLGPTGAVDRPVLVVGDSLALGMVLGPERESATEAQAAARGLFLAVDGYSGTTWGQAGDPGRRPDDRLRGAEATDPSTPIVVVLGANDAGQAVIADRYGASGLGADAPTARETTRRSVTDWVPRLEAGGRCVVLVTAPDVPITTFGLGFPYAFEATQVNALLQQVAVDTGVELVPFAELSRAHHGPDGDPSTWFYDDQLHPNDLGTQELVGAVLDAVERCPAG